MSDPVILPRIPSALVRLALTDLSNIESDPRYLIDMEHFWHAPDPEYACSVCFAGVVMAGTLGSDITQSLAPSLFPGNESQLLALEQFMLGDSDTAIFLLGIHRDDVLCRNVTPYVEDPVAFRSDMNAMADYFEGIGL